MSLKLVAEIDKADLPDIGGVARAVLVELALFADDDGGSCRPSVSTLARKTQFRRDAIIRALDRLAASGLVTKLHRVGQCGGYRIHAHQSRRATSRGERPVAESDRTSRLERPEPVAESDHTQSVLSQDSVRSAKAPPPKKPFSVPESDLPFHSAPFVEKWRDREQQLREKRCPLTPSVAKSQLGKLARMGEPMAIEALENAISGNWQGVFEPKHGSNGKHSTHNRGNRNINTANQFVPEDAYDLSKRPTEPDDESLDDKPF